MYVRTVLYVQYLIFLKTRKISEDLPICYRIRAVHGSRPFRAGPKPYRRASGTWQNPYSQRFCSKVLAKILQSAWLWRLPGASLAGRPLSARVFAFKGDWPEFAKIWNSDRNSQNFGFWPVLRTRNRVCKCHPIGSAEKSPSVFGFYYTIYYTIFPGSLALYGNLSPSWSQDKRNGVLIENPGVGLTATNLVPRTNFLPGTGDQIRRS
jgi:hypothetical protein